MLSISGWLSLRTVISRRTRSLPYRRARIPPARAASRVTDHPLANCRLGGTGTWNGVCLLNTGLQASGTSSIVVNHRALVAYHATAVSTTVYCVVSHASPAEILMISKIWHSVLREWAQMLACSVSLVLCLRLGELPFVIYCNWQTRIGQRPHVASAVTPASPTALSRF